MIVELRAIVSGHVQGVFFRATTAEIANQLQLTGTVANLDDGSVEIIAQGSKEALEKLLSELQGPNGRGKISRIAKTFLTPSKTYSGFKILK